MRPNPTRSLAIVVGALAVFGSVRPDAAQNFPPDPLAVRMPDDATEADVELIVKIAERLGVPFGFEAAGALSERVSMPFRPGPDGARPGKIVSVRPTPLDIRGVTLRQALDAAVAKDRRYEWRNVGGVVVVRPRAAWRDPEHPLMRTMVEGTSLFDHVNALARTGSLQWSLRSEISTIFLDRGRAVTVAQPVLTVGGPEPRTFPLWQAPSSEPPTP